MSEPKSAADGAAAPARVKRVVEALLFSSDRPISTRRLADLAEAEDGHQARRAVRELQQEYAAEGRAFAIEEIAGGFQLLSRPEFAAYVARLHNRQQQEALSKAALETLAIVAYRQPITRAEVEDIRGVQCGHILRSLVERRLLKVTGRSPELGRPLLYGTTKHFLEAFGLRSVKDLPQRKEFGPPPQAQQPDEGQHEQEHEQEQEEGQEQGREQEQEQE
jgi:segregation and condensation protein B